MIADFNRKEFDRDIISKIGQGSIGGKARGLAFLNMTLAKSSSAEIEGLEIRIPKSVVISTEFFDEFVDSNNLREFAYATDDDRQIAAIPIRSRAARTLSWNCCSSGVPSHPPLKPKAKRGFSRPGCRSTMKVLLPGTTSIQAADEEGWVVSITPSGGWIPAFIAGSTGIGLSQRMQSFVLTESMNPFNVVRPGQRPRATLTPSIALKEGKPYLAFSVQGGDTQDQNLLQFFLNMVEFDMNVQQAAEAHNITSYQMQSSFGAHKAEPGRLALTRKIPEWVSDELSKMGYFVETVDRTYSPITAIYFDRESGTMWGGASDYGEDYGVAW